MQLPGHIMPYPPGCQPPNLVLLSDAPFLSGKALVPYPGSRGAPGLRKWYCLVSILVSVVLSESFGFKGIV
jgi:hypothetical protein